MTKNDNVGLTVAVLIGGGYSAAFIVWGSVLFATESYPYAFGIDLTGDSGYPFPGDARLPLIGLGTVLLGLISATSMVQAVRGSVFGKPAAIGLMALKAALITAALYSMRSDRRCATDTYRAIEHCMSPETAFARDILLANSPAVLAMYLLVRFAPGYEAGPRS